MNAMSSLPSHTQQGQTNPAAASDSQQQQVYQQLVQQLVAAQSGMLQYPSSQLLFLSPQLQQQQQQLNPQQLLVTLMMQQQGAMGGGVNLNIGGPIDITAALLGNAGGALNNQQPGKGLKYACCRNTYIHKAHTARSQARSEGRMCFKRMSERVCSLCRCATHPAYGCSTSNGTAARSSASCSTPSSACVHYSYQYAYVVTTAGLWYGSVPGTTHTHTQRCQATLRLCSL